jgi:hypothetical protein
VVYLKEISRFLSGLSNPFTVPSGVPHAVQTLTPHERVVDAFSPVREDFL